MWTPTMPTIDPVAAAGLPDVAALTRLANDLFKALPGTAPAVPGPSVVPTVAAPPAAVATATQAASTPLFGPVFGTGFPGASVSSPDIPGEVELRAILAAQPIPAPRTPALPVSSAPSYYFIDDAG